MVIRSQQSNNLLNFFMHLLFNAASVLLFCQSWVGKVKRRYIVRTRHQILLKRRWKEISSRRQVSFKAIQKYYRQELRTGYIPIHLSTWIECATIIMMIFYWSWILVFRGSLFRAKIIFLSQTQSSEFFLFLNCGFCPWKEMIAVNKWHRYHADSMLKD